MKNIRLFLCLSLIVITPLVVFAKPAGKDNGISADQFLNEEKATLEKAVSELMKLAAKAADKGCPKLALDVVSLVKKFYPRDSELAKFIEELQKKESSDIPDNLQKEKETVYAKTAKDVIKYGDLMAKYGGPLYAQWIYKIAEEMGYPADKKKLDALTKPLEEFNNALKDITSDNNKCNLVEAPKTEYEYRFKLPNNWSIDNEWPVYFVFHGTGSAWGVTDDNEEAVLKRWSGFARNNGWIIVSIREPFMMQGKHPNVQKTVEAMEEILAILAVRYRANPNSVAVASGGSGAFCCWGYLEKHPERLCAVEICMGKFEGIGVKKGSQPAINVPVRLGIQMRPNSAVGNSGTTTSQHDEVHLKMMNAAKATLEQLGFTKMEYIKDNFYPGDSSWYSKCAQEKVRKVKNFNPSKR